MAVFLPWFPYDRAAFKAGTRGWTAEERWAYLELLGEQWDQGSIPNRPDRLYLFMEGLTKTRFLRMWGERIADKFEPDPADPDRLINRRMADERAAEEVKIAHARIAGRIGGKATQRAKREAGASAPLSTGEAETKRPPHTDHSVTSSYSGKDTAHTRTNAGASAREESASRGEEQKPAGGEEQNAPVWNSGAFEALWVHVFTKRPGHTHLWSELATRIAADAAMRSPPAEPAAEAEALFRAMAPYNAWAATQSDEKPCPPSVAGFGGWYEKLSAWVDARRAKNGAASRAPTPTPAAPPAECKHEGPRTGYGTKFGQTHRWFLCRDCKSVYVVEENRWYAPGTVPPEPETLPELPAEPEPADAEEGPPTF